MFLATVLVLGMQTATVVGYRFYLHLPPPEILGICLAALAVLCVLAYVLGGLHRNSAGGAGIIIVAVSAVVLPTLVLAANLGTMTCPCCGVAATGADCCC